MKKSSFFRGNNNAGVSDYAWKYYPEDCRRTIEAANNVVKQVFLFNLRWDLEKSTEPVVFKDDIDWLFQPGNDPEWVYAFNRMRYWICLGQAYSLTGETKYARSFVKQLCHWVKSVRPDDIACEKAWRSIEVGLRLEYWMKAICYFESSPDLDEETLDLFCASVTEHAELLMRLWDSYNLMSNWGILANQGLFIAGVMLPQTPRTREYTEEAIRRLSCGIDMQIYRDGTHWEQSPMYHNEVLSCFLNVISTAKRYGIKLPENILRKTHDMCIASLYAAKPNHHEVSMGDSDDIDQRDMLTIGAALFEDGLLKARGYKRVNYDSAWELGDEGLRIYNELVPEEPYDTDKEFNDSGNYYFRSGWDSQSTFLHFHCGTLGAGHGHADKLHIDIFSRGEDILLDSGRYTYVYEGGRVEFKQLRAHNTVMVDAEELYVCKDSWECDKLTRGVNRHSRTDRRYAYAEGGHLGYIRRGVYVNRRVIYIKPDIVILADEFYTGGKHEYNQFFHFGENGELKGNEKGYIYSSGSVLAQITFIARGLTGKVSSGKVSRHYNKYKPAPVLTTSFSGEGFTSAYTVIALSGADDLFALDVKKLPVISNFKGITFKDSQIEALSIGYNEREYTVVIAHEEYASPTDTFSAGNCVGFGNCVIFDIASGERETGTVLLW